MSTALRALIVDDDPDDYIITRDLLADFSDESVELQWEVAYDEALARMLREEFDIFLLDYRLGQYTGLDLLREAYSRGCRVPAILLTGVDAREIDDEARAVGVASFIPKVDLTTDLLKRSIRYAMEQAQRLDTVQSASDFGYAVLDALSAHIAVVDADGTIIAVNQAWRLLADEHDIHDVAHGIGSRYVIACGAAAVSGDLDTITILDGLQAVLAGQHDSFYHEYPCYGLEETQWFAVRITALRDVQYGRAVVAHENITARKRAEEWEQLLVTISDALQESLDPETTLTRLASQLLPAVADWCSIVLVDPDGSLRRVAVVHADPAKAPLASMLMQLPLDPESTVGLPAAIRSSRPTVDPDIQVDNWRVNRSAEYVRVHKALGITSQMNVPLIARGQVIGGIALIVGDSARRYTAADLPFIEEVAKRAALAINNAQLHHELQRSELRYRTLIEEMPGTVYLAAPDDLGHLLYQSPQIATLLGFTAKEWTENPWYWHTRLHPDDAERVRASDAEAVATGEPFTIDYRTFKRDGSLVWVRDYGMLMRDEQGEPLHWLGITLDITEQKAAEEALRESEQRLRDVVENIPAVTYTSTVVDGLTEHARLAVSRQITSILGYSTDDLSTRDGWNRIVHPDDRELVTRLTIESDQSGEPFDATYRVQTVTGNWRWIRNVAVYTTRSDERVDVWQGFLFDVSDQKDAEVGLRESESRFRSAFDDAATGMALVALDGTFLRVNRAYCQMLGYQEDELLRLDVRAITHTDDIYEGMSRVPRLVSGELSISYLEKRYLRKDGTLLWGSLTSSLVRDDNGSPLYLIAQVQDITERKELERQITHQAFHDALTGLPNRVLMRDRIEQALASARRYGQQAAVLFLDLDNFKIINDSLGHSRGDDLLVEVSRRLLECVREVDTVTRFGGDEFVIVLTDVRGLPDVLDIARRVAKALDQPVQLASRFVRIHASIGIVVTRGDEDADDVLRHADIAMYRAKNGGRNRIELFDPVLAEHASQRLEREDALRHAIEHGDLVLHYQPKISIPRREVIGVEALVRWQHSERGLIFPGEFIDLAEETGLIVGLGEWVLEEACRQFQQWRKQGIVSRSARMSVNLSGKQFSQPDLVGRVSEILEQTGLGAEQLVLEITETVMMEDIPGTVRMLEELKALGIAIAIDDFGMQHSSLARLSEFPVDYLKIDRHFVARLGDDLQSAVIVSGIIGLAHALGMQVVAEGVETPVQLGRLQELGCEIAQGYLFSKPISASGMQNLLERTPWSRTSESVDSGSGVESTATPAHISVEAVGLHECYARYLSALLDADPQSALQVLQMAMDNGVSVEQCYLEIIASAQYEIGRLWQENRLSIAQEHLATNISQQALALLSQSLTRAEPTGKRAIVACVQGEQHWIGARIVSDFFETEGFEVRFLGADVPTDSLIRMVVETQPDVIALSVAMTFNLPVLRDAIDRIRAVAGEQPVILVGGRALLWSKESISSLSARVCTGPVHEAVTMVRDYIQDVAVHELPTIAS